MLKAVLCTVLLLVTLPSSAREGMEKEQWEYIQAMISAEKDPGQARELLHAFRADYPESDRFDDSLLLSARVAVTLEEPYKARFHLKKLITESTDEKLVLEGALLLADLFFLDYLYEDAATYYRFGLQLAEKNRLNTSRPYLQLSWIAYYHSKDTDLARSYFRFISLEGLDPKEKDTFAVLKKKLLWKHLLPADYNLEDGNISAIKVDDDDLWIGTWNGGIARYSYSTGKVTVFNEGRNSLSDNTIRAIEVGSKSVWVGTYEGLWIYSKSDSTWSKVDKLGETRPGKISLIRQISGKIYVGTLGNGLWEYAEKSWKRIREGDMPGEYILCLEEDKESIYIGTMTAGVFLINKKSGKITSFNRIAPGLEARNITMLMKDKEKRLWIGTYGQGLYMWDEKKLHYFSQDTGEIKDNWVLCGQATEQGLYFGTFGGGVSFLDYLSGKWSHIGIPEGLSNLDIATISYARPTVYFGTLGSGISLFTERIYD